MTDPLARRAPHSSQIPDPRAEILFVDDDAGTRRLLSVSLESAGFAVRTAGSGEECLRAIEEGVPDVVVLDFEMAGLNGAEVCRRIRAAATIPVKELPVIMLTSHTSEAEEIGCLEAGANDFVTKPVSRAVLQARIQTQMRLRAYAQELERWRAVQEADLAAARATQEAIVPPAPPTVDGWEIAARFEPLIQVGGDIYGWEPLRDGKWFFWLADGAGHGASAALLTALTAHLFRKAAEVSSSPAKILSSVNQEFIRLAAGRTFMTACCMVIDADGAVSFAGAGHPPLLIQRQNGRIDALTSERTMIGIGESPELRDLETQLAPGETALLYTDGLYSRCAKSGERFTHEMMRQLLGKSAFGADPIADLIGRIEAESDLSPVDDDTAVIALRRRG